MNSTVLLNQTQSYPMKMSVTDVDADAENGVFTANFSADDYFREEGGFIPPLVFMELLGQTAEKYYISSDGECKRYLASIEDFNLNEDIYDNLDRDFSVKVNLIDRFGKLYRGHVSLVSDDVVYCEGTYVHCNE